MDDNYFGCVVSYSWFTSSMMKNKCIVDFYAFIASCLYLCACQWVIAVVKKKVWKGNESSRNWKITMHDGIDGAQTYLFIAYSLSKSICYFYYDINR